MNGITVEAALDTHVNDMLDACTKCSKCFEACPTVQPAGISGLSPDAVVSGILDIVRTGDSTDSSRKWAPSCMLSGECIKACEYGVDPRFRLTMARVAILQEWSQLSERRREGVLKCRGMGQEVAVLARLQLDGVVLEQLGQRPASEAPDFIFYTGCNVVKTPHIALLALDIMDRLGISYQVLGGPSHCCASCNCERAMWKRLAA